jgi:hypothetical protein
METLILMVLRRCSRQLLCFTLFAQYFLQNPAVFDQIKSGFFATRNGICPPFCHLCHFLVPTWNLSSKAVFLVSKLVCFAISSMQFFLNKMVSPYDTHWGNFNKFAKFVKMARVQRVKQVKFQESQQNFWELPL